VELNRARLICASCAIVLAAVLSDALTPRELMARTAAPQNLSELVPLRFGPWTSVPSIGLVTPVEADGVTNAQGGGIYSQVVGRGYSDANGDIVMLLVAYGPVQDFRMKAHRPELCYVAGGFRVSSKTRAQVRYREDARPLDVARLVATRESRVEPISYWMRVGDDLADGVIDRQIIRLKYGLRGIIPDGALIRVSTTGLPPEASYRLQDRFIHDLLGAIKPEDRRFFTGRP
jgi:EpsI family protein